MLCTAAVRKRKLDSSMVIPLTPCPNAPKGTHESRIQEKTDVMGTLIDRDTIL